MAPKPWTWQSTKIGPGPTPNEPPEGWQEIDAKTGAPVGIDRGFDYAPGANAGTAFSELIGQKLFRLDAPIGAAMWQMLRPVVIDELAQGFSTFVGTVLAGPPRGKSMVIGALKPSWVQTAESRGISPATADITVRDQDIWHTFRTGKADQLDLGWYKDLPRHVDAPDAVLLDSTHSGEPAILLIYNQGSTGAKLVVRINYRTKKLGEANIVETGKKVDVSGIRAQIGHGYDLIEGSL
jgi:hypothetical protein